MTLTDNTKLAPAEYERAIAAGYSVWEIKHCKKGPGGFAGGWYFTHRRDDHLFPIGVGYATQGDAWEGVCKLLDFLIEANT